jgi:hypothetical protein
MMNDMVNLLWERTTQHTIVIRIFHDVIMHNQLQAHQSFKLINDINIVKSLIYFLNIK